MFWPRGASSGSSIRPPWSSDSLSSRAEHSMPKLSTPRSLPILIRKGLPSSPGGSSAPTVAQGTRMPTRALGAPQTDRKSTRQNSSHSQISYAVFCLKKKKKKNRTTRDSTEHQEHQHNRPRHH